MVNFKRIQTQFEAVRSNKLFELFIIAIIVFSALVVGVKTYAIPSYVEQTVAFLDLFITLVFLIEIVIRFIGEPNKRRFFLNGWNVFDTLIVVVSLIPIEDGEMAVSGRLIRIFRVLRMISIIPELRIIITALLKALPQLGYVMLLMFIIFYIYAAIGSTLFAKINPVLWGDIAISMLTLFRVMTFEDWTDVMYETMEVYGFSWIFYLSFIFFTAFAFLNMVIGIVVSVMDAEHRAATKEDDDREAAEMAQMREEVKQIKAILTEMNKR